MTSKNGDSDEPEDYTVDGDCYQCEAPVTKYVTFIRGFLGWKKTTSYTCAQCGHQSYVKG